MSSDYDRREFLKWIGASLLSFVLVPLGLAGCSGDGGNSKNLVSNEGGQGGSASKSDKSATKTSSQSEKTHQVPHPKDDTVPESEATAKALGGKQRYKGGKSSKDGPSVMYQHEPNGQKHCGNCTMYVPDKNDDGFGACTLVEGKIHPCDFCILYSKHTGEGSIPCKSA